VSSRNGLSAAALDRVCAATAPGGRVVRVRPLRGGLSSSVHVVHVEAADGVRHAVVVRRYTEISHHADRSAACELEFKLLTALAATTFPVPAPLLFDAEGGPFGAPTMIMTRLPGKPLLAPGNLDSYLRQMARMLAELHALPVTGLDFVPDQRAIIDRNLHPSTHEEFGNGTFDAELRQAVRLAVLDEWARISKQPEPRRVLVHGDYWPGNLLWRRGRLIGVVDWEQPRLGDPAKDVATCRGDLSVLFGLDTADAFTAHYERASGHTLTNLRFWDLFVSTWAVPEMPAWLGAYQIFGRPELTPEVASERIGNFARAALADAENREPE
jgi:aminoglycoside phosphotransferase (APT) family kinase protein